MKNIVYLFLMFCIVGCNNKASENTTVEETSAQEYLLNAFPTVKMVEGPLHFYNIEDDIEESLGDSIVEKALSESLLEKIGFQTGDTKYETIMQYSLGDNYTACILNANESWYKQQSLLLYNNSKKVFEDVVSLSQFYGGDGGQIVIESWLYTEGEEYFLYQKESSHAMVLVDTSSEPEEFLSESSSLYKWKGNSFESIGMKDSVALAKRFELSWEW